MKNNFTLLVQAGFIKIQSMMKLSAATLAFLKVCMLKIPAHIIRFLCSERMNQDVGPAEPNPIEVILYCVLIYSSVLG